MVENSSPALSEMQAERLLVGRVTFSKIIVKGERNAKRKSSAMPVLRAADVWSSDGFHEL